ncbi:Phage tail fiber protein [hydrothermal vent metagenome]|uniref:Phage tail fiber protein n=1 Tax=hydrothermal vent metagenome TaxID=652676 RepID=A0A3B0T8B9_9ZZZZ
MKKSIKTAMGFFTSGLLIFILVFSSCAKDGDIGPQGEQGIAGQDGTDGTDGADGNANVQLYTLEIPNMSTSSGFRLNFDVLTPEVLKENIVLLYLKTRNGVDMVPGRGIKFVAGTDPDIPFNITSRLVGTGSANIKVFFTDLDGAPFPVLAFHYSGLNVFIIKPSTVLTGKSNDPDFFKMSYEEVVDYFGLTE